MMIVVTCSIGILVGMTVTVEITLFGTELGNLEYSIITFDVDVGSVTISFDGTDVTYEYGTMTGLVHESGTTLEAETGTT
jgi:hypothetical protein